jgi:Zn-dependent peptidase ImmA (M78 family)
MRFFTTADLAARFRTSRPAILKRAKRRDIKPAKTTGRTHLWSAKQAKQLKGRA